MKKEKQVRSYKRRTKSGKTVTVKSHTAKYEASDRVKEISKKEGAGKELEERKKKPVQLEIPFDKEEEKKVLDEVKETAEKKTTEKKSDSVVYKHKYGPKGNGDPKRSAENNAVAGIRESSAAKDALRSSDATTFEQFKRTKGYRDLSPAAKEWAHYYRNGGWLKNSDGKESKKESTKKPAEKKTTEKVRPVGSGTKEPTPKRKSEAKVAKTTASKPATSELAFTTAEFKEWYRGTGSAADKKVAKALRAQLGRSGYRKLEDEAIDNYSSRGHLSLFKGLSSAPATKTSSQKKEAKVKKVKEITKAAKSESSKGTTKEDKLFAKISEMQKTWDKKYHRSDKNGGEAFRKKLNKLEDKYNEMTAGEKLGVKSSSKKK